MTTYAFLQLTVWMVSVLIAPKTVTHVAKDIMVNRFAEVPQIVLMGYAQLVVRWGSRAAPTSTISTIVILAALVAQNVFQEHASFVDFWTYPAVSKVMNVSWIVYRVMNPQTCVVKLVDECSLY